MDYTNSSEVRKYINVGMKVLIQFDVLIGRNWTRGLAKISQGFLKTTTPQSNTSVSFEPLSKTDDKEKNHVGSSLKISTLVIISNSTYSVECGGFKVTFLHRPVALIKIFRVISWDCSPHSYSYSLFPGSFIFSYPRFFIRYIATNFYCRISA